MKRYFKQFYLVAFVAGLIINSNSALAGALDVKMIEQNAVIIKRMYDAYQLQGGQFKLQKNQFSTQGDQLNVLRDNYKNLTRQLETIQQNLKSYGKLKDLLPETNVDNTMTTVNSDLSQLYYLNPKNKSYANDQQKIIDKYYATPISPEEVNSQYGSILSSEQLKGLSNKVESQYGQFNNAKELVQMTQQQVTGQQQRQLNINNYKRSIGELGDKSELATAQISAGELLLISQQQEEILKSLRSMQMLQETQRLEKISAEAEQNKAQLVHIKKESQAASVSIPENTWGDF